MTMYDAATALATARSLAQRLGARRPTIAVILGSGLGGLVTDIENAVTVPYGEIPAFPTVAVHGHAGQLIAGAIGGAQVLVFAGRFHYYEGHPIQLTAFPIRVAHALGVRTLFVSNAAGGVNTDFAPGDLMVIDDHLNLMGTSPLIGTSAEGETRFPDMSHAYDPKLRDTLHLVAREMRMELRRGVYAALQGPSYETPAEVRMLRTLGADAVGMSTVPEVIQARALDMRVAGVSCITNLAAGIQGAPLDHAEVLATTTRVATQFQALVRGFLTHIARD